MKYSLIAARNQLVLASASRRPLQYCLPMSVVAGNQSLLRPHSSGAVFMSTSQLTKCLYRVIKALEKGLIREGQCSMIGWTRSPSVIHWAERDSGFTCRSPIIGLHFSSHPPRGTFSPRLYSLELSISRSPDLYGRLMALPASDFPNLEEITVDRVSVKIMHRKKVVPWIDAGIFSASQLQLKISESRVQPSRPSLSPLPGQVFDTSSCIYAHPFLRDEFFRSLLHHATSPSAV